MDPAANQRIAPGRVLLIMVLLLAVWLIFQFWPQKKPAPAPLPPVQAESKLQAVGLANNPDWDGLPEQFAVWADKISWNDDTVRFAYWNPGSRSYSYFFEAKRVKGKYRFRAVSLQESSSEANDFYAEDGLEVTDDVRLEIESPTHPFVFPRPWTRIPTTAVTLPLPSRVVPVYTKPTVPIDLKSAPMVVPPSKVKAP